MNHRNHHTIQCVATQIEAVFAESQPLPDWPITPGPGMFAAISLKAEAYHAAKDAAWEERQRIQAQEWHQREQERLNTKAKPQTEIDQAAEHEEYLAQQREQRSMLANQPNLPVGSNPTLSAIIAF